MDEKHELENRLAQQDAELASLPSIGPAGVRPPDRFHRGANAPSGLPSQWEGTWDIEKFVIGAMP
jgi:hypothetical protein